MRARRSPCCVSPNTSIGVNVLIELVRKRSARARPSFRHRDLESHHREQARRAFRHRAGAGRGALQRLEVSELAEVAVEQAGTRARVGAGEIGFSVCAAATWSGEHTVLLSGARASSSTLTHRATDRAIFARGALRAARWLAGSGARSVFDGDIYENQWMYDRSPERSNSSGSGCNAQFGRRRLRRGQSTPALVKFARSDRVSPSRREEFARTPPALYMRPRNFVRPCGPKGKPVDRTCSAGAGRRHASSAASLDWRQRQYHRRSCFQYRDDAAIRKSSPIRPTAARSSLSPIRISAIPAPRRKISSRPQIYAAGLVVRDLPLLASNWRCAEPLRASSQRGKLVAIADIDTRKLTRILREKGAQAGCIMTGEKMDETRRGARRAQVPGPQRHGSRQSRDHASATISGTRAASGGSEDRTMPRPAARLHVVAYDFGVKRNILRLLADYGCRMTVVPAQTSAERGAGAQS